MTRPSSSWAVAEGTAPGGAARLCLDADLEAVRALRPWLERVVEDRGGDRAGLLGRLELALHELCVNVIDHAYGDAADAGTARAQGGLVVELWNCGGGALEVVLRDRGRPFDPAAVCRPDPDVPQVRGYGLMIVEQLVDELTYEREGDHNVWRAVFGRAGTGPSHGVGRTSGDDESTRSGDT